MAGLSRMRRARRLQTLYTLGLVFLGPILAFATFVVLGPLDQNASSSGLRIVLLADLVYILVIAALVSQRVARLVAARRAQSAGSRLHLRLTGVFAVMALIPTITVAVFAMLSVNMGLEAWFSDRVRDVVAASRAAAESYEADQRVGLQADATALAGYISVQRNVLGAPAFDDRARQILSQGQAQIQRGLREAFLIDANGEIVARGERSYLFDYERPTDDEIAEARDGGIVLIRDWDNNEFRALVPIRGYSGHFLYVTRLVDGTLLQLLDETEKTAQFYQQKETERGRVLFDFALLYLGFAVLLILASVWLGLWFAERLSRPVGRLTGAAQQVGAGNLDVRVFEEEADDEIALLSRYFNQMTRQLKGQRETLLTNTEQIERRRRLFDSVLSSVTSGVVGLDPEGRVTFVNRSAQRLLDWKDDQQSVALALAVPEFGALFDQLLDGQVAFVQDEIKVSRAGKMENLLVRMARRIGSEGQIEGYVVAFDDVTDLVSAQRMAAWGDVARRIAHEIKNPLTPIQLSAERIKRKFSSRVGEESDQLEQMTDVIVRQTNDLRRIVDEFSKFARMPEPVLKVHDIAELLNGAVMLQDAGQPDVRFVADIARGPILADVDDTMISQAFTNLMKNAGEATETYAEKTGEEGYVPEVRVSCEADETGVTITISDNGIGLPEDRARLFEPYVTTRDKGTGLGLPIVKKIIEEHGGTLTLEDAEQFDGTAHQGAKAIIRLPLAETAQQQQQQKV
ncbi:sensor histidine kinase NtrY-like [Pseudaestuariivita atlantica]|nr:PAS domain-containing sensor histidine kinase [Pseudaestuariivita atlantica]